MSETHNDMSEWRGHGASEPRLVCELATISR
jgi:hypothetical protein